MAILLLTLTRRSLRSVEFRITSSLKELISDKTGHLYNPFGSHGEHEMHHLMLCEADSSSNMQCDKTDNTAAVNHNLFKLQKPIIKQTT